MVALEKGKPRLREQSGFQKWGFWCNPNFIHHEKGPREKTAAQVGFAALAGVFGGCAEGRWLFAHHSSAPVVGKRSGRVCGLLFFRGRKISRIGLGMVAKQLLQPGQQLSIVLAGAYRQLFDYASTCPSSKSSNVCRRRIRRGSPPSWGSSTSAGRRRELKELLISKP